MMLTLEVCHRITSYNPPLMSTQETMEQYIMEHIEAVYQFANYLLTLV